MLRLNTESHLELDPSWRGEEAVMFVRMKMVTGRMELRLYMIYSQESQSNIFVK